MKKLIQTLGKCSLFEVSYITKWEGCQCFKDCSCKEDWLKQGNPQKVTMFDVFTGRRTHSYRTLEIAQSNMERIVKEQNNQSIKK